MKPDRVVIGSDDERSARADEGAVRAVHRTGAPIMMMDTASAELSQVRGELDPRDAHLVHERDRQRLRAGRRRRRSGAQGDRRPTAASAPRSCFPASATAAAAFPKDVKALLQVVARQGVRLPDPRRGRGGERQSEAAARRARCRRTSASCGAGRSRCGGWRSSRGPTTCARRRRSPSSSACSSSARRCAPTIRKRATPRAACSAIA